HSWSVKPETINGKLRVTAMDDKGLVMGISHTEFDVKGLQFHPESILTEGGEQMIKNWLMT
ncbi:MAG: aminodeoxychorismate/anthranilate synthase component II, partial [Bacteroidota bacterium]